MTAPIPVMVRRYRCPHCPRSLASKQAMVRHIARCWWNPDARSCKTCAHYSESEPAPYSEHPYFPEECEAVEGHDLKSGLRSGCAEWESL